ncbi:MAG: C-type lectin domain-containing protein [Oscillospiraceae bacterium]|nr:C-type lectin domain-containing protein [Oscillospiraceae bacterium]
MTWYEAEEFCEDNGGYLVTITSEEEQAAMELLLENGSKKQYWIGLTTENGPTWVTGEAYDYSNWDRSEPNSHTRSDGEHEYYVHIYNVANPAVGRSERFKWNDMYFDNTYPGEEDNFGADTVGLICEYDTMSFTETTSDWSTSEIEEAYESGLIPEFLVDEDLTERISRAEFASVSLKLYEALTGETVTASASLPFTDVAGLGNYSDIQKVYALDITASSWPQCCAARLKSTALRTGRWRQTGTTISTPAE